MDQQRQSVQPKREKESKFYQTITFDIKAPTDKILISPKITDQPPRSRSQIS